MIVGNADGFRTGLNHALLESQVHFWPRNDERVGTHATPGFYGRLGFPEPDLHAFEVIRSLHRAHRDQTTRILDLPVPGIVQNHAAHRPKFVEARFKDIALHERLGMRKVTKDVGRGQDLGFVNETGEKLRIEKVQILCALQHVLDLFGDAAQFSSVEHFYLNLTIGKFGDLSGKGFGANPRVRCRCIHSPKLQDDLR